MGTHMKVLSESYWMNTNMTGLLKPWHMGTHMKALSLSYPMNTNMTGFR